MLYTPTREIQAHKVITMQEQSLKSAEAFHQRISLLFHVTIALPLAGFVYIFLEMKHNDLAPMINTGWLLHVINFGIVLVAIGITAYVYTNYRRKMETIKTLTGLRTKLANYLALNSRSYFILGVLAGFIVAGLFLTTSPILIVAYVSLLFLLSLNRPTPRKYVSDLDLKGEDKDVILKKQELPVEE